MLYKFRCAMARFMYGRNGVDQLNRGLMILYLGLFLLQMLAVTLKIPVLAALLEVLVYAAVILVLFRTFSKNLPKRRAENQRFINWWWRVKNDHNGARARHADKEHKYFTCKQCKTICRVPVGKGKIVITCPKCGAQIQAKT